MVEKQGQVYIAPDYDSQEIITIHEGLKVRLLDQLSGWHKVRLPNGEVGWLPVDALEKI